MTPLLLFPIGLVVLAALALPLLIHLRRRTEEVPVDFAAMRWLEALPKPRRKLRFDELLLLALRLLLVALLALFLARPAVLGLDGEGEQILVAPGIDPAMARELGGADTEMRWIAPAFPSLEGTPPTVPQQLSSLIRQFDAELPPETKLTLIVPAVLDGVDADPIHLTREVEWRIVDGTDPSGEPDPAEGPALAIRHVEGMSGPVRYFRAASDAWSERPEFEATADSDLPAKDTVLVWLKPGPLPRQVFNWVEDGGTALLGNTVEVAMPGAATAVWRDATGSPLVEGGPVGAGRLLRFTRPLTPAEMPELLEADFSADLRDLLTPPAPPPSRVDARAFAPSAGMSPFPLPPRELSSWLALVIALAFLTERLLATRRKRLAP